jgi:hypothetical protein
MSNTIFETHTFPKMVKSDVLNYEAAADLCQISV